MDTISVKYVFAFIDVGPGGLRATCVLACAMRSLAIVITIVQSLLLFFFSLRFLGKFYFFKKKR